MFAKSWLFRLPALAMAIAALTPAIGTAQTSDKIRVGITVSSTGSFALASQSGRVAILHFIWASAEFAWPSPRPAA